MLLPLFIDELDPWFAENHPTSYAFIEDGFTVYKDKVIVYNVLSKPSSSRRTSTMWAPL